MSLGVSKESKIGLAVPLGLTLLFAAVVVRQVARLGEAQAAPSEGEKAGDKDQIEVPRCQPRAQSWMASNPTLLIPAGPANTGTKPSWDEGGPLPASSAAERPSAQGGKHGGGESSAALLAHPPKEFDESDKSPGDGPAPTPPGKDSPGPIYLR